MTDLFRATGRRRQKALCKDLALFHRRLNGTITLIDTLATEVSRTHLLNKHSLVRRHVLLKQQRPCCSALLLRFLLRCRQFTTNWIICSRFLMANRTSHDFRFRNMLWVIPCLMNCLHSTSDILNIVLIGRNYGKDTIDLLWERTRYK